MQSTGNTLLITGAGSGIGRELARRFQALGNTVIVAGRRPAALQETIAGRDNMQALTLDVDDPRAIETFAERVLAEHPRLNVLVNNAGIMRREDLSHRRDLRDAEATFTTNLLGPLRLTNALVEQLLAQPGGAIINVSSGLAMVPLPGAPSYNASKAALHSYTQSLRAQLRGRLEVIEIMPPAVQTELTPGQSTREGYQPLQAFMDEVLELLQQQPTPEEILVKGVHFLRWAERDGHFAQALELLSSL